MNCEWQYAVGRPAKKKGKKLCIPKYHETVQTEKVKESICDFNGVSLFVSLFLCFSHILLRYLSQNLENSAKK